MSREHTFEVNSVVSKLKTGERPDTGGLVLISGWGWGRDASTGYADFAADMAALDPDSLHVYDARYLHCTVATLSRWRAKIYSMTVGASRHVRDLMRQARVNACMLRATRIIPLIYCIVRTKDIPLESQVYQLALRVRVLVM